MVIGTPVLNRSNAREKEMAGMFISVVPVRLYINSEMTFEKYTDYVHNEWKQVLKNQKYPYDMILSDFRELHRNSENLYDIVISFQNTNHKKTEVDYSVEWVFNGHQADSLVIHISDREDYGYYTMEFDYLLDVFTENEIEMMFLHFSNLLKSAVNDYNKSISKLEMLSDIEKNKILNDFNNTGANCPKEKDINRLFEEQVQKSPDAIAVVFEKDKLTYRELNKKANRLAWALRERGVQPDSIVAVLADESLEMFIGILGVLKAGGAYLPIDPSYPKDRIEFMLNDSKAKLLLKSKNNIREDVLFRGEIIDLKLTGVHEDYPETIQNINKPYDLAYVIYTSGSTGVPKGVMIEHSALVNLCMWHINCFEISQDDRASKYAGFGFDASVWEIFPYLISGAAIYVISNNIRLNIYALNDYFIEKGITVSFLPTQICENFIKLENSSLRLLLTGGDKLKSYNKCKYGLVNNYGPTENAVVTTSFYVVRHYKNIPIGKPVSNVRIYIVDEFNRLRPVGFEGELCISGDSLARGYLNNPELTNERFVENPFEIGRKMYKTGDIARWLPDGNIEFLGRMDNQVKIRGNRIELGEIETNIMNYRGVLQALVLAKEDKSGNRFLCAYILAECEIRASRLKAYLSKNLPDYMIPAFFIQIDHIPLNANGKIDFQALPELEYNQETHKGFEAPRNGTEELLVNIWQEVLDMNQIGIHDNFFELGGDSIRAIQVSAGLSGYGFKMETGDIFNNPTIAELGNVLVPAGRKIDQKAVNGQVKLTPIQNWFFSQKFADFNHFNQSVMLSSSMGFNADIVEAVFTELIIHHDALRMVYKIVNEQVVQINRGLNDKYFDFVFYDLKNTGDFLSRIKTETEKLNMSMDLEHGPLVKLALFQTSGTDYLAVAIHHLVVDGVSWRILLEDFQTVYNQIVSKQKITLPDKTDSFMDWAEVLYEFSTSKELLEQIKYWEELEKINCNTILKDYHSNTNMIKDGKEKEISLNCEQTGMLLKEVNKAYNTEINDILLTALGLALKEWTNGIDKIMINLESHGRENISKNIDISRTIGWFTSTYPVLIDVSDNSSINGAIKKTKETLKDIPLNGVGYGILRYLSSACVPGFREIEIKTEISFNYLGQLDSNFNTELFSMSNIPVGSMISPNAERKYLIDINGMVISDLMTFSFNYNGKEFEDQTIEKLTQLFKENLIKIIDHCTGKHEIEYSLSDFSDTELLSEDLDEISNLINNL